MMSHLSGKTPGFLAVTLALALGCSDSPSPTEPTTPAPPPSGSGRFVATQLLALPGFASALVFTGPGRILYTEKGGFGGVRDGSVRLVEDGRLVSEPVITFADVETRSEKGLLGITLDPDYASNRLVYAFYTHARSERNRVVRFRDDRRGQTAADATIILGELPTDRCGNHQGGSIAFGPDSMLYITIGDNGCNRCLSQDNRSLAGKILRFTRDGAIPDDNPFSSAPFPRSAFFATGLRNSFDFTIHPSTGEIVATENGPSRNDEINHIVAGRNYGWPFFQCGDAQGDVCPSDRPEQKPPLRCHVDVIAPTGITFYDGDAYPAEFRGSVFYGDFNTGTLRRLVLSDDADRVLTEDQQFLSGLGPIIDIVEGPDGLLYVLSEGAIHRIDFLLN
jgi:glucose/arabinose dehydrogenase